MCGICTCILQMCDMTHSYVRYDINESCLSFMYVTWLIHMCDMTQMSHVSRSCMWHDSFIYAIWHKWVMSLLTEELRPKIFGSLYLLDFRVDLVSDRDSIYSRENLFEIMGTPVKTCLRYTGTPVKTCWKLKIIILIPIIIILIRIIIFFKKKVWHGSLVYVTPCSDTPLIYLCYRSVSFRCSHSKHT